MGRACSGLVRFLLGGLASVSVLHSILLVGSNGVWPSNLRLAGLIAADFAVPSIQTRWSPFERSPERMMPVMPFSLGVFPRPWMVTRASRGKDTAMGFPSDDDCVFSGLALFPFGIFDCDFCFSCVITFAGSSASTTDSSMLLKGFFGALSWGDSGEA